MATAKSASRDSWALGNNKLFFEIIEKARAEFETGKSLSLEEMKRAVLGRNAFVARIDPP
jgi:hypothetical protein